MTTGLLCLCTAGVGKGSTGFELVVELGVPRVGVAGMGVGKAVEEGIADGGGEGGVPGERLKEIGSGSGDGAASAELAGAK